MACQIAPARKYLIPYEVDHLRPERAPKRIGLIAPSFLLSLGDDRADRGNAFRPSARRQAMGKNPVVIPARLVADKLRANAVPIKERHPVLGAGAAFACRCALPLCRHQLPRFAREHARDVPRHVPAHHDAARNCGTPRIVLTDVMICTSTKFRFNRDMTSAMMVEVPAAVMILSSLRRGIDFVSIRHDDLLHYPLAVDRANKRLSPICSNTCDPSVLRADRQTIQASIARIFPPVCADV